MVKKSPYTFQVKVITYRNTRLYLYEVDECVTYQVSVTKSFVELSMLSE
jgi:hypothetical protein